MVAVKDISKESKSKEKHGLTYCGIYSVWVAMIDRCFNERCKAYKNYGGRGITVCDRWMLLVNFHEDMFGAFKPGLVLDRADNNGNYCKDNCSWVTYTQNNRNTRWNRIIEYNGESLIMVEFCEKYNLNYARFAKRLNCGWSIERAAEVPARKNDRTEKIIEYNGERMTIRAFSKKYNLPFAAFNQRIYEGWETVRAVETPFKKFKKKLNELY